MSTDKTALQIKRNSLRLEQSKLIHQAMGLKERIFEIQQKIKSIDEELNPQ